MAQRKRSLYRECVAELHFIGIPVTSKRRLGLPWINCVISGIAQMVVVGGGWSGIFKLLSFKWKFEENRFCHFVILWLWVPCPEVIQNSWISCGKIMVFHASWKVYYIILYIMVYYIILWHIILWYIILWYIISLFFLCIILWYRIKKIYYNTIYCSILYYITFKIEYHISYIIY